MDLPSAAPAIADAIDPEFKIFVPSPGATCWVDAVLCPPCQDLINTVLPSTKIEFRSDSPFHDTHGNKTGTSSLSHHKTLEALAASGSVCQLCNLIARESQPLLRGTAQECCITVAEDEDGTGVAFWVDWKLIDQWGSNESIGKLPFRLRINSITASKLDGYKLGKLLVRADGAARLPDSYPATADNLTLIRSWIDACTHHGCCQWTRLNAPLPKRVLDISRPDDLIMLYESKGETASYAALSYCWGNGLPLRTLTANISQHMQGIPLETFPKTMRDIIPLARHLAFRYIWIDALCIIQDDAADWQEQATAMTAIFQGCSLNIAVSDAPSCDSGATRTLQQNSILLGTASIEGSAAGKMEVVIVCEPTFDGAYSPDDAILSTRGWVFQETLVSAATLYICHRGLYWECRYRSRRQGRDKDLITPIGYRSGKEIWASNVGLFSSITPGGKLRPVPVTTLWALYLWVAQFSERRLTLPKDKLPAISGLVSRTVAATGATYVAGLWKQDILLGLTWHIYSDPAAKRYYYGAPSWSWASVDGRVEWVWCISVHAKYPAYIHKVEGLDLNILEVVVDEVFPGSFGEVKGGRITAIGTLYEKTPIKTTCFWDEERRFEFDSQPKHYFLRIAYVVARRASIGKLDAASYLTFLILEKADEEKENEFRRVGYAHAEDPRDHRKTLEPGERKKITLI